MRVKREKSELVSYTSQLIEGNKWEVREREVYLLAYSWSEGRSSASGVYVT